MPEVNDRVIEVEDVTVRYGRVSAAEAVSFSVGRGRVTALLGRNGAGKSSLVRCLLGQQHPQAGICRLFGADTWKTRRQAMVRTGVVPEESDLPPAMNVRGLEAFCARLYPSWDADAFARRLEHAGVPLTIPAGRLSKGQRAQLQLSLALAPRPELLILDDPTLGLDAVARREFYQELVGDLADRGTTVLIATHDLAGVEGIADDVTILLAGRVLADESIEALRARFRRVVLSAPVNEGEIRSMIDRVGGVCLKEQPWGAEMVASHFDEAGFATLRESLGERIEAAPMNLEEIFVAVAGQGQEVAS